MSAVQTPPEVEETAHSAEVAGPAERPPFWRRHWRLLSIVGVLVLWRIGLAIFRGEDTLAVGGAELNDLQEALKLGDRILIMRDGKLIQLGTPDEIVAAPADDYVRDFVSDVPRSHVVTLKWVMRPPAADESLDGPVMKPSVVVRDAAREGLASDHPIRVMDNGELLGVVSEDDLIRVIVAEQEGASA